MEPRRNRYPVFRGLMGSAFLLSALYLALGVGVGSLVRLSRAFTRGPVEGFSRALDALPAGILDSLGVLGPLSEAYALGRIDGFQLRLLFGGTAVGFFFVTALGMVFVVTLMRAFSSRFGSGG